VNKHLTSLLVKFIMIGLISVIILPLFAQISSGQAILIAVVLTVVAYLLGDLMVLPRYGNTTATVLDVVLAAVVLRIVVVTAAAMLLATFNARDFILGLVQWKVPYELAFMVFIALRFLPVFRDELVNVVTAVQLRGIDLKKVPWGQKIAMYRRLLFPVIYGAMLKAQRLAVSMEARGFRVYPRRTYLRRLNFRFVDYMVLVIFPLITIVLILLQLS
jgi:energy-coupling factor transport system permease protein